MSLSENYVDTQEPVTESVELTGESHITFSCTSTSAVQETSEEISTKTSASTDIPKDRAKLLQPATANHIISSCTSSSVSQTNPVESTSQTEPAERQRLFDKLSFIQPYVDGQIIEECDESTVISDPSNGITITLLSNSGKGLRALVFR